MLGSDHTETLEMMRLVALMSIKIRDWQQAGILFTECYTRRKELLGREHAETLIAMVRSAAYFAVSSPYFY